MKSQLQITLTTFFFLKSILMFGQTIDVEIEKFPKTEKLIVKSYNGCCSKKGYRAEYFFDNVGKPISSNHYFKSELRAINKYNNKGFLIEVIRIFDIGKKDTTKYEYTFDTNERITSKVIKSWNWSITENYLDFDSLNNPQTTVRVYDKWKTVIRKTYDSLNNVISKQIFENDTLVGQVFSTYNNHGDLIFNNIQTFIKKDIEKMETHKSQNIIEKYFYTYDNLNRWTKKYVVIGNREILLEKRIYK